MPGPAQENCPVASDFKVLSIGSPHERTLLPKEYEACHLPCPKTKWYHFIFQYPQLRGSLEFYCTSSPPLRLAAVYLRLMSRLRLIYLLLPCQQIVVREIPILFPIYISLLLVVWLVKYDMAYPVPSTTELAG
ncbi:hypothetical protein CEXT_747991 [Caerostris extrusa]|uniref:Uncharacterized protein n=1 Tax=Caerostris extrusa TaxID=172846 RepID=A0AAV4T562_CAEEX|nr:hypothetical protein CEXT_747991 [Caerostris extrusa]